MDLPGWEALHREVAPAGIDIVTVCLDVEGRTGAAPDLAAVEELTHIAVVDETHLIDELFGITNVPMGVWIDEDLRIVRPAEFASPAVPARQLAPPAPVGEVPDRMIAMRKTAGAIKVDRTFFVDGVRDWAANGAASSWALTPEQVIAGSATRGVEHSEAAARFELGQHLHHLGHTDSAVGHFREAHRLDPHNWTYKRQAWELASRIDGPFGRFWQGPLPGAEDDWPYDGDWLTDMTAIGPENYYPPSVSRRDENS